MAHSPCIESHPNASGDICGNQWSHQLESELRTDGRARPLRVASCQQRRMCCSFHLLKQCWDKLRRCQWTLMPWIRAMLHMCYRITQQPQDYRESNDPEKDEGLQSNEAWCSSEGKLTKHSNTIMMHRHLHALQLGMQSWRITSKSGSARRGNRDYHWEGPHLIRQVLEKGYWSWRKLIAKQLWSLPYCVYMPLDT